MRQIAVRLRAGVDDGRASRAEGADWRCAMDGDGARLLRWRRATEVTAVELELLARGRGRLAPAPCQRVAQALLERNDRRIPEELPGLRDVGLRVAHVAGALLV